jgi:hypothetical protein
MIIWARERATWRTDRPAAQAAHEASNTQSQKLRSSGTKNVVAWLTEAHDLLAPLGLL